MMTEQSAAGLGVVDVIATENRGLNAEELAEMALNKILYCGKDLHPLIKDQAFTYRNQIKSILVQTITKAQKSERTTLYNLFKQQGHEDMAEIVRKL